MLKTSLRLPQRLSRLPRSSVTRSLTTSNGAIQQQESRSKDDQPPEKNCQDAHAVVKSIKTVAQSDEELMQKLAAMSGEGGEAGIEYEDGKAVAMKRSVKNNMFRLI